MNVVIAEHAGACYGVERALSLVDDALRGSSAGVFTLGPLIHNPAVVGELAGRGVSVARDVDDAAGSTLVLRTHGVTPAEEAQARKKCAKVVDATCPFVMRAHQAAEELASAGYQVVVVGEVGHPEVEGTLAHASGSVAIGSAAEALKASLGPRVGLVVQTTQTRANLRAVIDALLSTGFVRDLRVIDTICEATSERQLAAARLAGQVDCMVVIGGRNSANTTHLAEICASACPNTHHIELADELDRSWFAGVGAVGVTAGASTPQSQIDAVVLAIDALSDTGTEP